MVILLSMRCLRNFNHETPFDGGTECTAAVGTFPFLAPCMSFTLASVFMKNLETQYNYSRSDVNNFSIKGSNSSYCMCYTKLRQTNNSILINCKQQMWFSSYTTKHRSQSMFYDIHPRVSECLFRVF